VDVEERLEVRSAPAGHVDRVDVAADQRDDLRRLQAPVRVGAEQRPAVRRAVLRQVRLGDGQVDQLDVVEAQADVAQGALVAAQRGRLPEVDLVVQTAGKRELATGQVLGTLDAAVAARHDGLVLLSPREPDQAHVGAAGAGPERGDVAALAKRVGLRVAEVRLAHGPVGAGAQRGDRDAVGSELGVEPTLGDREARRGRHRAAGVPEVGDGRGGNGHG
jgi:hypothetical protein